jgi:protein-tyrosine phosphatase
MRALLLGFVSVISLAACSPATTPATPPAAIASASAENGATRADYRLTWSISDPAAPVRIEASTDPDAAPGAGTVVAEAATGGELDWTATEGDARRYFMLTPEGGKPVKTSIRVLPLEGGRNFRDLGGYAAADGKTVKWGKVYRSGVMAGLTPADYAYLSGLGVKVVCDFRDSGERTAEPTNWTAGQIDYVTFADVMEANTSSLMDVFKKPGVTPEDVAGVMTATYPQIARDHAPMFEAMFDRLAAGQVPLAFNCSAGKDRTGVAAAFLLTVLGVPRETILTDYAMSEKVVDFMKAFTSAPAPATASGDNAAAVAANPYAFMASLPPEIVAPLMRSDPRYLEAVFADAEAKHGSVMAYIQAELNVTDEEIAAIRALLLE